ncbi:MAG: hypothetical protein OHK0046_42970 [Anaerolineae bacterium]
MQLSPPELQRELKTDRINSDLVIVGGGLSGTCAAITAARHGLNVTLVQDRPVLGGNASSEVRLWALGATAHMGNNNRWARESGVIGEILVENMYRNPEGNALILDTILLEKVIEEPNIRLLLNTAAFEVTKSDPDTIQSVRAFCSQNSTMYELYAPLFCDASGDGIVGFMSGAAFRMGAETHDEFDEKLAPDEDYGHLLGHSIYFYTKDVGQPVRFVAPSYALDDITKIPRWRNFNSNQQGCQLWWIEYGGRMDTVHDTETIKWELWKVVYGVWDYIKNSGKFPDAETKTLEWVGTIPGKRESRRFEGDYMLIQRDIVEQRTHEDAVSFGGWAMDLHPADGIYSEKPGCSQWHSRGVYQIPYRMMYSRNINNLFLAGRIISASHVAFGSTRVMLTSAHAAQSVGVAAMLCQRDKVQPRNVDVPELQRHLLRANQYIPHLPLHDKYDLARQGQVSVSSALQLAQLPPDGPLLPLDYSWAQMLPVAARQIMPDVSFCVDVEEDTELTLQLRTSDHATNHTPDVILASETITLLAGKEQTVTLSGGQTISDARYVFVCLLKNSAVQVHTSNHRITGLLAVANAQNPAVSNFGKQEPVHDIGVESFEFWVPMRRPQGQNLAFRLSQPLMVFNEAQLRNGFLRPTFGPNAWVADLDDSAPSIAITWEHIQTIQRIELVFDTDFDHPMECVLMTHPERVMPFCVKHYRICDDNETIIYENDNNHQSLNIIQFDEPINTCSLKIEIIETWGSNTPAAVFDIRCFSN